MLANAAPEVNLRYFITHITQSMQARRSNPDFETQARCHPKFKKEYQWPHKKGQCPPIHLFLKVLHDTNSLRNYHTRNRGKMFTSVKEGIYSLSFMLQVGHG